MFRVSGSALPGGLLAVVLAWAVSPVLCAQEVGPGEAPVVMMLVSSAQERAADPIIEAIAAQLSDLDVRFDARVVDEIPERLPSQIGLAEEEAASGRSVIAVFWYDQTQGGNVYLFLAGPEGDRILVRKLEDTGDRGRAEGLAIIVRSSVMAMLQGGRIGIAVEDAVGPGPAPEPALEPAPEPVEPPLAEEEDAGGDDPVYRDKLQLNLAYSYHARSGSYPAVSGMSVGLDLKVVWKLYILASYTILQPVEGRSDIAAVRVKSHPVAAGLGLLFDFGRVHVGGRAAALVDVEDQEVGRLQEGMTAAGDDTDVLTGGLFSLDLMFDVARRLDAFVSLGFRAFFEPVRYTASSGETTRVLVDAWPVQPWLNVGIRVGLI